MSSFWPLSIPQGHKRGKVPGTSNWIAEILHDCNTEVLQNVNQVYGRFSKQVDSIDDFMKQALDELKVDLFISSFGNQAKSTTASPSRLSPVKTHYPPRSSPLVAAQSSTRNSLIPPAQDQIIIPYSPKPKPKQTEHPDSDDSLHKIQMSIRRRTETLPNNSSNNSSTNNTLSFPAKTPKRSPTFVSLPPKEPLTIKSSASHIRKSLALTKDRKDKSDTGYHNDSPIRRSRFPSSIAEPPVRENSVSASPRQKKVQSKITTQLTHGSPKASPSKIPVRTGSTLNTIPKLEPSNKVVGDETSSTSSPENMVSRPRNLFYNVMTPTAVHRAYTSSRLSPARRILSRTSKTPSKNNAISRSSISSLDTNKPGSKSPTRYTDRQFKRSSIASKDDDTDSYIFQKSSVPQKRPTTTGFSNPRTTKTPKHNDGDAAGTSTRNKFLTTSLNPNNGPLRLPAMLLQSPIKTKPKVQPEEELKTFDKTKLSLDPGSMPPLRKKSLMLPKTDSSKPKQKIVLSMGHHPKKSSLYLGTPSKSESSTPTLNSVGASKHKLELPQPSEVPKKRALGGNAVALPEAARPQHINRSRETNKNAFTKALNLATATKPDLRPQLKTPKRDPTFQLFKNLRSPGEPELPDIDTDDEDNASKRLLKTWAATPELRKLILKNNQVDPKTIFGEVPKLRMEDIFKSEASRLRGNATSPVRYNKDVNRLKDGSNSNVKGSV